MRAVLAASLLPLAAIFPMYLSIDTLALLIFLGAVVLIQEKRERMGMVGMILAAAMHLALLPIVAIYPLGMKLQQRIKVGLITVVFLIALIGLTTQYGGTLRDNPFHWTTGIFAGILSAGIALVLFGPVLMDLNIETPVISWAFFASMFGAIAAAGAMAAGAPTHFNMRYFVPAVFLGAALFGARKRSQSHPLR